MDFALLRKIDQGLDSDEVGALKFLCRDCVSVKKLESARDGRDLFSLLEEQGLLEVLFVKELLETIRRKDLSKLLGTRRPDDFSISPYRRVLYELSEDVTEANLKTIKFLSKLPEGKLELCTTFLDVMVEMEKLDLLGEESLGKLEEICGHCNKQLSAKLQKYKAHRTAGGSIVQKQKSAEKMKSEVEVYDMSHRPRGYCLIVNNYNFEEARKNKLLMRDRRGTDRDAEELTKLFSSLHFVVDQRKDLTGKDLREVVTEFAGKNHAQLDAFVCCLLSHGDKGTVHGTDGQQVPIADMTRPFSETPCPTLAGKPKLFFIQACQGSSVQGGLAVGADAQGEPDNVDTAGTLTVTVCDPDFLLGMATVEDYKSFRNVAEGSIYIQELCRQLRDGCARNEDILTILTRVNREVSCGIYQKQMPEPRYTLTRRLVLTLD